MIKNLLTVFLLSFSLLVFGCGDPEVKEVVKYHENGKLREKGTLKDGKRDGPWVRYYDNGKLDFKGTYKNGEPDGPYVSYYTNGQLFEKGTYKNGKRDGPWEFFEVNGSKRFKPLKIARIVIDEGSGTYRNGKKVD